MKLISHFNNIKKTIFSFEIIPPLRYHNILEIFNTLYSLIEFLPPFINVTSHINNELQKSLRRIGTIAICGAIISKYEIDAIPHFLCGGFTKQSTENALIEVNILGIYNIFILRGDIINNFTEINVYRNSIELVKQIISINKGIFLNNSFKENNSFDFCIGVAGYPEKHFEAPNIEEDLFRLFEKIKEGCCYIITQMFFDNNKYYDYIERIRFAGLKILIIPGIKPILSINQLKSIPSNFYVNIPTNLIKKIIKYKKKIFSIGIKWAINQSIELKETGIPVIHFYTMSKPDNIYQIVIELF